MSENILLDLSFEFAVSLYTFSSLSPMFTHRIARLWQKNNLCPAGQRLFYLLIYDPRRYFARRSVRPASAPVGAPLANAICPLTITISMPMLQRTGSS